MSPLSAAWRWTRGLLIGALFVACGASSTATRDTTPQTTAVGEQHSGDYNLGPVELHGSFWNSCAPYTPELERQLGTMLAGLALKWNGSGALCDACVLVKSARGKSIVARVITTGETQGANDMDLSQAAFDALSSGEYPRKMTWEVVKCPASGKLEYQFQTEANAYWTSLWVRNSRLPIKSVEVKSQKVKAFTALKRGGDGTLTLDSGFGEGPFTLRVTSSDGQTITDDLQSISPGAVVSSSSQFE